MSKRLSFRAGVFEELVELSKTNADVFDKIMVLIKDVQRDPFRGLGKPEPLKHNLKGLWSRRITHEHRLVYEVTPQEIIIVSCLGHY
jgi:toxin YoeB